MELFWIITTATSLEQEAEIIELAELEPDSGMSLMGSRRVSIQSEGGERKDIP